MERAWKLGRDVLLVACVAVVPTGSGVKTIRLKRLAVWTAIRT